MASLWAKQWAVTTFLWGEFLDYQRRDSPKKQANRKIAISITVITGVNVSNEKLLLVFQKTVIFLGWQKRVPMWQRGQLPKQLHTGRLLMLI
jgi:hypothetical protein